MIDESFVKRIEELKEAALEPKFHMEHGINHTDTKFFPLNPPLAGSLDVTTLTGVSTYCKRLLEAGKTYTIQIVDHKSVHLSSNIDPIFRTREHYVVATTANTPFSFGRENRVSEFIIALQSMFVQDDTTALVLSRVGNISLNSEVKNMDDGISQTFEARTGIARAPEEVKLPNPVKLRPYRTFPEIDQPESMFVIRISHNKDHGFLVALHEADGGAWKIEAIAKIKEWFEKDLKDLIKAGTVTVLG